MELPLPPGEGVTISVGIIGEGGGGGIMKRKQERSLINTSMYYKKQKTRKRKNKEKVEVFKVKYVKGEYSCAISKHT